MSTCFLLQHWYYGDRSDPVAVYLDEQAADRESERLNELLDGNPPKRNFRAEGYVVHEIELIEKGQSA